MYNKWKLELDTSSGTQSKIIFKIFSKKKYLTATESALTQPIGWVNFSFNTITAADDLLTCEKMYFKFFIYFRLAIFSCVELKKVVEGQKQKISK